MLIPVHYIESLLQYLFCAGVQISFNQSSYMFNESQGFASFGIYGQGNISEPIFINVTTHAGIHWIL